MQNIINSQVKNDKWTITKWDMWDEPTGVLVKNSHRFVDEHNQKKRVYVWARFRTLMFTSPMAKDLIFLLHAGFGAAAGDALRSRSGSEPFDNLWDSGAVVTSPKCTLRSAETSLGVSPVRMGTARVTFAFISLSRGETTE